MIKRRHRFLYFILIFLISSSFLPPQQKIDHKSFSQAYKRGKTYFYKALNKYAPEFELDPKDEKALREADKEFPRLFNHLMNFYFHAKSSEKAKQGRFPSFILSLSVNMAKELLQSVSLKYLQKAQSPLNSILISTGYYSRKNIPDFRTFFRPMSPILRSQWALDETNLRKAHKITKGEGISIAVVDSGVDSTIKEINANIVKWKNFLDDSRPINDKGKFPYDWGGHGTSVATLIYQAAPRARTMVIKIHDDVQMHTVPTSRWTWYLVSAGIIWAMQNGADIISLSVSVNKDIDPIKKACKMCWEKNVILITPMGNVFEENDENSVFYPAAYTWTIAVGGVEKKDGTLRVWDFSSSGDYIDVVAPASRIIVETPSYIEDPGPPEIFYGNSLAVPIVAGAAALVLSSMDEKIREELKKEPGKLVETVRQILRESSSSEKLGFSKPNPRSGYGLIDSDKAVHLAKSLQID